jgi:hypothetical protein
MLPLAGLVCLIYSVFPSQHVSYKWCSHHPDYSIPILSLRLSSSMQLTSELPNHNRGLW